MRASDADGGCAEGIPAGILVHAWGNGGGLSCTAAGACDSGSGHRPWVPSILRLQGRQGNRRHIRMPAGAFASVAAPWGAGRILYLFFGGVEDHAPLSPHPGGVSVHAGLCPLYGGRGERKGGICHDHSDGLCKAFLQQGG